MTYSEYTYIQVSSADISDFIESNEFVSNDTIFQFQEMAASGIWQFLYSS